ncbi:MAG: InlB B-repeat-containing protein, partial [Prevotellaceae bacterium]|nr:InlB B-repeat-containing protein [Prevotellaceae bacterium]
MTWGEEYVVESFPTKGLNQNGGEMSLENITWSYSKATYLAGGNALQIGSKNNPQTTAWTISTPVSNFGVDKRITAVSIDAWTTSATATYDISVGGVSLSSGNLTTTSATYKTSEISATTGDIVITLTGSGSSKAIYLDKICVTYTESGNVIEPTKYLINLDKNIIGGSISANKETAEEGATVLLTATPDNGYEFNSWNVTNASTEEKIAVTNNEFTMPATDVKVSATFNTIPTYTVSFSVNGIINPSQNVVGKKGTNITFPAIPSFEDVVFRGWTKTAIDGTQENAPDMVDTSAEVIGTENVTYYAVFATAVTGSEPTAYTAGSIGNYVLAIYSDSKWYALPTNPTISSGKITGVEIPVSTSSSSINYVTASNASGYTWTIADATNGQTISDGIKYIYHSNGGASGTNLAYGNSTSYTWKIESETNGLTFKGMSGSTVNSRGMLASGTTFGGYALSNEDASGYNRIHVLPIGGGVTYSDYCTTVSAKATATLEISDKAVSLGYNETKDVTISISEQEYDGTLTVASSNESVATVTYSGTTATIKYEGEGEAYISVTAPSTANYYAINAPQAIKVTATDDRQDATVTIDPATISVDNGASAEFTVTTAYDGTITATSDKPTVATVSYANGKVTVEGKSVGTATLTISGEGNATYKPFSNTFVITVNKVVPVGIKNLRTQIISTDRNSQSNYEVKLV